MDNFSRILRTVRSAGYNAQPVEEFIIVLGAQAVNIAALLPDIPRNNMHSNESGTTIDTLYSTHSSKRGYHTHHTHSAEKRAAMLEVRKLHRMQRTCTHSSTALDVTGQGEDAVEQLICTNCGKVINGAEQVRAELETVE